MANSRVSQWQEETKLMTKLTSSHSVINIVPPRDSEAWKAIQDTLIDFQSIQQSLRTLYTADARCGPHISFIDPFLSPNDLPRAAEILTEALEDFPPFTLRFSTFSSFVHAKSATLFLEPEVVPHTNDQNDANNNNTTDNLLQQLARRIVEIFPQCNDQFLKSGSANMFVPHLSIGRFRNKKEVEQAKARLEKDWEPVEFTLKEIYMITRVDTDPFELRHAVPLGGKPYGYHPSFGPDSLIASEDNEVTRTLVIAGLPKNFTDDQPTYAKLLQYFEDIDPHVSPIQLEIIYNPNGKARPLAIASFADRDEADRVLRSFERNPHSMRDDLKNTEYRKAYIKPLHSMFFPDVPSGVCSLKAVQKV